jgi:hypothetical protein
VVVDLNGSPPTAPAKGETAKGQPEAMKADVAYRVAHAQLAALICRQ